MFGSQLLEPPPNLVCRNVDLIYPESFGGGCHRIGKQTDDFIQHTAVAAFCQNIIFNLIANILYRIPVADRWIDFIQVFLIIIILDSMRFSHFRKCDFCICRIYIFALVVCVFRIGCGTFRNRIHIYQICLAESLPFAGDKILIFKLRIHAFRFVVAAVEQPHNSADGTHYIIPSVFVPKSLSVSDRQLIQADQIRIQHDCRIRQLAPQRLCDQYSRQF